jgi:hypothetical protein
MEHREPGHSGGCQCGAVRYHVAGPLLQASFCHCRMCQKASGNIGIAFVAVPLARFAWTRGTPAEFRSSRFVARGFCAACGTPLYLHEDGDSNIELYLGTLDEPAAAEPLRQVGTESKLRWFDDLHRLPARSTNEDSALAAAGRYVSRQHPDHDTEHWP